MFFSSFLFFFFFRKSHTSVHNAPSRSPRPEILKVICMCIMDCGHLGAIFVAAVSVNLPISRTTCYCILADVPVRKSSRVCPTTDRTTSIFPRKQIKNEIYRQNYFSSPCAVKIKLIPLNVSHCSKEVVHKVRTWLDSQLHLNIDIIQPCDYFVLIGFHIQIT